MDAPGTPHEVTPPDHKLRRLRELALNFLKIGATAFGGPPAHIAMMEEEFVGRRGWLDHQRFLDLIGAVNLLPGPNSTELALYIGLLRAGWLGLMVAGFAFILPSATLVLALAWAYVRFGALPQVAGVLYGTKPVVIVVVVQALWVLGRTAIKSRLLAVVVLLDLALLVAGVHAVVLLLGTGMVLVVARWWEDRGRAGPRAAASFTWFATGSATATGISVAALFFYFMKVGVLLFGSGFLLLAFLRADLVAKAHWLSETQLLDAIAVSQATPGPLSTVATFIGYVLAGWPGAVSATMGVFLPAFLLVAMSGWMIPRLRQSPLTGAFLDGVNAAALALMAAVTWQLGRASGQQDSLAVGAGLHDFFVRARRFGKRHLFADDRTQRAVLHSGNQSGVDALRIAAAANDDNAPAHGKHLQVGAEINIGQHLENYIHTAAAGEPHQLIEIIWSAVVERVVGAFGGYKGAAFFGAAGADDGQTRRARDQHRGDAHTAAGSMNQNSLAGASMPDLKQRAISCGKRNINARALHIGDFLRERVDLRFAGERELGIGAGQGAGGVHPVARFDARHAFARGFDNSRTISPRGVRQFRLAGVHAGTDVRIHGIHAGGLDANQDLSSPRRILCGFFQLQNFRAAKLAHHNGSHCFLLRLRVLLRKPCLVVIVMNRFGAMQYG